MCLYFNQILKYKPSLWLQDEYDLSTKEIKKIEKIMKLIEMRMEKL